MFRIGEFSRITRVTIDTLRHYDALGLLKPAKVDPFTGYRYYSARQLVVLNRIMALKEVGFSLEEIARILREKLSNAELRGMLKAQLMRVEQEAQAAQLRRERILARLNSLNLEDDMPEYEVTLKPVERLTIAAIRETVPAVEDMPERCSQMFDTIERWMRANRLPLGPSMSIYYNEGFTRENIDTECSFIIPDSDAASAVTPEPPVAVRKLDPVPLMASTMATEGFYKKPGGLLPAYQALAQWIEDNGYQITGPPRELFYGSAERGDLTAEVQYPVERV
ncbi:MAG TPA: MerR family transcriptional regulator [Anaerolineales bacterium]|nr:MerR family transcriptional regulator [Anaerolineales bacterium]